MQQTLGDSTDTETVLFVHAHPDDETISTGGTIATLVNRGARVVVLTCTRGELGEVIPPELAHLGGTPALADHREIELAAALAALGVTDHHYLGEGAARREFSVPRRYLDSGMQWSDAGGSAFDQAKPRDQLDSQCLSAAAMHEVIDDIGSVINATGATAVVSYDDNGGYGHPDHIRAGAAARRAADAAGVPFFEILTQDASGQIPQIPQTPEILELDVSAALAAKTAALRAHRTQVTVHGDSFALSNGVSQPITATERFRRVQPEATDHGTPNRAGGTSWLSKSWREELGLQELGLQELGFQALGREVQFIDHGIGIRVFSGLVSAVAGLSLGGIVTINHQFTLNVGRVVLPFGIVVSLVLIAALVAGLRLFFNSRLLAAIASAGIMSAIALLSQPGSGGSVLVPANAAGYLITFGPLVIAVIAIGWPTGVRIVNGKIVLRSQPKGKSAL